MQILRSLIALGFICYQANLLAYTPNQSQKRNENKVKEAPASSCSKKNAYSYWLSPICKKTEECLIIKNKFTLKDQQVAANTKAYIEISSAKVIQDNRNSPISIEVTTKYCDSKIKFSSLSTELSAALLYRNQSLATSVLNQSNKQKFTIDLKKSFSLKEANKICYQLSSNCLHKYERI